jgi:outer membrane biosynthesis protein TonB
MIQRKKRNSSKVNLTISAIFHAVLICAVFFLAAREGMLGKKMKQIAVNMVKEKKAEPPKEKPPEPKVETAKAQPKAAEPPKVAVPEPVRVASAAPPPSVAPAAAPPAASLAAFDFNDGAKEVQTTTDKNVLYKGLVEAALRTHWTRPEGLADSDFVAEVEVAVDPAGKLASYNWLKGSGNKRWDDSVKTALAQTKAFSHAPPKGFPDKFLVRFDVEVLRTEPLVQVSQR